MISLLLIVFVQSMNPLDTTFNGTGKAQYTINSIGGNSICPFFDIAEQADGKMVLVGTVWGGLTMDSLILRLDETGQLDTSFSLVGWKKIDMFGSESERFVAVALSESGNIYAAGYYDSAKKTVLYCFDSQGNPDPQFGSDGYILPGLEYARFTASSLVIQSDGKLVLAGHLQEGGLSKPFLYRFLPDGSSDADFGIDGTGLVISSFDKSAQAKTVLQDANGDLLLSGSINQGSHWDGFILRYSQSGFLDANFGINGTTVLDLGFDERFENMTLLPDQRIIVVGRTGDDTQLQALTAMYMSDGVLDSSFGVDGIHSTSVNLFSQNDAVAVRGGLIWQAGGGSEALGGINNTYVFRRCNMVGNVDPSFGNNGEFSLGYGTEDKPQKLLFDKKGRLWAIGFSKFGPYNYRHGVIVRFHGTYYSDLGVTDWPTKPVHDLVAVVNSWN